MAKVIKLVPVKKSEECFLRIDGPSEGYGPFNVAWDGVSSQMIVVLEEVIRELRAGVFDIIQEEKDDDGE